MNFNLQFQDQFSKARAGEIETDHGKILTPIFMPVGTAGTVKAVSQNDLTDEIKSPNYTREYLSPLSKARH